MRCLTIRWRTNASRLCSCSCRKHDRWGWPNGPIYLTPLLLFTFFSALPHFLHLKPRFFTSQALFLYISSSRSFFISIWLLFCVIASFLHHNTFSFSPPFPLILPLFPFSFFPSFPSLFLCLATFVYILLHCTSTICVVRKYLNG